MTLDTIDQDITITGTGRALDGPADLPPAAPVPEFASKPVPSIGLVVKKNRPPPRPSHSQLASSGGGEDDDCDGIDDPFLPLGMAINEKGLPGDSKKNTSAKKTNMVRPYPSGVPGEVAFQRDDLVIPTPAGAPLAWTCT